MACIKDGQDGDEPDEISHNREIIKFWMINCKKNDLEKKIPTETTGFFYG